MAVTVTMPQLGETVTEGTILSWAKQPGDTIAEDEVLLEISTDKVDTEVPSPAAGVIKEILVAEGETVSVGTPLAIIGDEGESAGEPAAEPAAEPEAMEESEADPGDEWPAEDQAAEDQAAEDQAAEDQAGDGAAAAATPDPEPESAAEPDKSAAPAAAATSLAPSDDSPRRGVLSPVVRKLAAEHDVDLESVTGTGEGGRITRKDVMDHVQSGGAKVATEPGRPAPAAEAPPAEAGAPDPDAPAAEAPAAPAAAPEKPAARPAAEVKAGPGQEIVDIPRLRRRIAENMIVAKQTAAHVWTSVEVDYENVERVRQIHKAAFKEREGFSLTYLPFISRATMEALSTYPAVNSAFYLDQGKQVMNSRVHLGIAVDVDQQGLVVVTLKNADGLRLTGVAREIVEKAAKARAGKLEPDDVSGSTFTITNPGPFGSFMSAPIINVPNAAILSTDTVAKRPTVVTLPDGTDTIAIRHIGYLGLTWDHRVFDGSTAVLFLQRIKHNLETWDWEQELA